MAGFKKRSPFSGVEDAEHQTRLDRLPVGKYKVRLENSKFFETRTDGRPCVVVEEVVLESNNPDVQEGERYAFVKTRDKFPEYFLGVLKNLVAAALADGDESQVTEAVMVRVFDKDMLNDQEVMVHVTRGKNPDFPEVSFRPVA